MRLATLRQQPIRHPKHRLAVEGASHERQRGATVALREGVGAVNRVNDDAAPLPKQRTVELPLAVRGVGGEEV